MSPSSIMAQTGGEWGVTHTAGTLGTSPHSPPTPPNTPPPPPTVGVQGAPEESGPVGALTHQWGPWDSQCHPALGHGRTQEGTSSPHPPGLYPWCPGPAHPPPRTPPCPGRSVQLHQLRCPGTVTRPRPKGTREAGHDPGAPSHTTPGHPEPLPRAPRVPRGTQSPPGHPGAQVYPVGVGVVLGWWLPPEVPRGRVGPRAGP